MVYDVTFYIIIFFSLYLSTYVRYYLPLSIVIIIIRKKGVPKHMFDLIKENVAYESFLMYDNDVEWSTETINIVHTKKCNKNS